MSFAVGLLILLIIVLLVYYVDIGHQPVPAGSRAWNVLENYTNKEDAAKLLSDTNARMIEFMRFLRAKYHVSEVDDDVDQCPNHDYIVGTDEYKIVTALLDNYNPEVFYENPPNVNGTSYTLNKGTAMYICLRNADDPNQLVDPNLLLFVMLHEASHIANYDGWGHSTRFWQVFKFILQEAMNAGIYQPVNYKLHPMNYCGLHVDYNPLYDPKLRGGPGADITLVSPPPNAPIGTPPTIAAQPEVIVPAKSFMMRSGSSTTVGTIGPVMSQPTPAGVTLLPTTPLAAPLTAASFSDALPKNPATTSSSTPKMTPVIGTSQPGKSA